MAQQLVLLRFISLLLWLLTRASVAAPSLVLPGCKEKCGNVDIPYPFGFGRIEWENCFKNEWFAVTCNESFSPPKPFLTKPNLEVLNITIGRVDVNIPAFMKSSDETVDLINGGNANINLTGSRFSFSSNNTLVGMDCHNYSSITGSNGVKRGCVPNCSISSNNMGIAWNGTDCCEIPIPPSFQILNMSSRNLGFDEEKGGCKYAFLSLEWALSSNSTRTQFYVGDMTHFPVALDWNSDCYYAYDEMNSGKDCLCPHGYEGSPFLRGGCTRPRPPDRSLMKGIIVGVVSGMGLLFILLITSLWLYKVLKKRRNRKIKEFFFKRNGGMLLQQQISSEEGSVGENKIFNAEELEKATDNYNENRILGQGGQGTVYKGMLYDGRTVAIKKAKLVDEGQVEQFINEVAILSQINHRNVVKLLGCCLETDVPLLVYEFISNGTLFSHIHNQSEEFPMTWDIRLRILTEVAGALAYLHSSASIPIYHRDIKSTNILLDDKHRAKVSDFGTSRSVPLDKTHLTTHVQGTWGYLDPEYFQSSQFTDKSDVYSFGVVLVELLTGEKPISLIRSQEKRNLVTYFIQAMKENRLFEILDEQIVEGRKEEIKIVASLAKRCLNLNGKERPTMKEVAIELEGLRMSPVCLPTERNHNEVEIIFETSTLWDTGSTSTGFGNMENSVVLPLDAHPLLLNRS